MDRSQLRANSILLISAIAILACTSTTYAKGPDTLWTRIYGGFSYDEAYSVQQTADSGFIIAGDTESFGAEAGDVYLLKTDARGDTIWSRIYGGGRYDGATSVVQTFPDSGYVIAGTSHSYGRRYGDILLIKTDAAGDTLWMRTYFDGLSHQKGECVRQTSDGGYIVVGATGDDYGGLIDAYAVRTNPDGDTLWVRRYGYLEGGIEHAYSVVEVASGGFAIAGKANMEGQQIGVYLVRIDAAGGLLWQRTYAAHESNCGYSIDETDDGGFIVAGTTHSGIPSRYDIYLVKTDENGDSIWTRTYGGSKFNFANSVMQTADGSYIIAGLTSAFGAGYNDVFTMQVSDEGKPLWARAFGGAGEDVAYQVQQTGDGGFIIAGSTTSFGRGHSDVYLLRLAPTPADPVEPDLAIGVLQNPYMTQYLDIYLLASERLDSASVELKIGGDSVGIHLLDPDEHLWRADYRVEAPGGVVSIRADACDLAGNDTTVVAEFSAGRLSTGYGGSIISPDGRVQLSAGGGALYRDVYAVILPCPESERCPGTPVQALQRGFRILSPSGATPMGYYIGPAAALGGDAHVEFSYRALDLPPGAHPDQLYIKAAATGALESYIDENRQAICATISSPGTFSLALGRPGASRRRDDLLLDIAGSFPNPFSQATVVRFGIASRQRIKVTVYDVLGREVALLLDDIVYPGSHEVVWRGRSQRGSGVSSGHYFVRIESEYATGTAKVNLIK